MYMNYKNILNVLDRCDDIRTIKDIINSVNDNQIFNKEWLIESCFKHITNTSTVIVGGWYGFLGDMLTRNDLCDDITICDMDPKCKQFGKQLYPQLKHITQRMSDIDPSYYNQIICTACEHISDNELNKFLSKRLGNKLTILQSNNYFGIDGHINCKDSLQEFKDSIDLQIIDSMELYTPKYNRFMVIGY